VNKNCPKIVLFTAFQNQDDEVDEVTAWRSHLDFSEEISVPGIEDPVYFDTDREIALVVTSIGNVEAAITVNTLVTSSLVNCEDSYFLTVGSAGTSPEVGTLGSVFINDCILDWNQKHRWSPADSQSDTAPIRPFSFKSTDEVCKRLNPSLVATAHEIGSSVELADSSAIRSHRKRYPHSPARSKPTVAVGTSVSGSEFWHGATCSSQAQYLADGYSAGTYSTTEMEGFGTAVALERHGLLDQYLSIRGISNFDRPLPGQDINESISQNSLALEVCLENVYRVGSSIISTILTDWELWRDGVPSPSETAR